MTPMKDPDWTVELDETGKISLVKFQGLLVGRVTEATLVTDADFPYPKLRLEIVGPLKITLAER